MLTTTPLAFQYSPAKQFAFPAFSCAGGETVLVCGPSGCGKTTLLHLLAGFLKPTQGEVTIDSTVFSGLNAAQSDQFRGHHIGLVFQKPYFLSALSVLDNLLLAPFFGGKPMDKKQANTLAEQLGIAHTLHQLPDKLSIGEQQRASIARALMIQPKVILADEPTSALDDDNCAAVLQLLQEQAQRQGAALIVVTHDARLKEVIGHQILLHK